MPELPEVEGFRQFAEKHLVGRRICDARFLDPWMLKGDSSSRVEKLITGREISSTLRHGKVLALFTSPSGPDAPVILVRFGMTGRPVLQDSTQRLGRWDRILFDLDDGNRFVFRDQRRLGSVRLVDRKDVTDIFWRLGPDALEAPRDWFVEAVSGKKAPIKAALLDQGFLAGLGNIYADEALFAARISPKRISCDLTIEEARTLHRSIRKVLRTALRNPDIDSTPNLPLFKVRRAASKARSGDGEVAVGCPNCGRPLSSDTVGSRTTFFCSDCQV